MLRDEELSRVDNLVEKLNSAPRPDHMALSQQTRAQRDLAFQRMLDEGLSWGGSGEAMGAHPILNQPEANFWMELQSIDNNLGAQLGIIEHYMPKWFSMGEFPPPYYGMRVAIILRKAKEHDRERRFLAAYLKHFRSEYGGSRTDEKLIERAVKLGIELPPIS